MAVRSPQDIHVAFQKAVRRQPGGSWLFWIDNPFTPE